MRTRLDARWCWGGVGLLLLLLLPATAAPTAPGGEPTVARVCFWVPPERMASFAAAYETRLAPILRQHGLAPSAERGRATVDSVFSRLRVCASPAVFRMQAEAVERDAAFRDELRQLAAAFGPAGPDGRLRHSLQLYRYPLLPDTVVPAGPGRGHWRTFDASDRLYNPSLGGVWQDGGGFLWFDSDWGVFQYDGRSSRPLFPHLSSGVTGFGSPRLLDGDGVLWISADQGGVLGYDGQSAAPIAGLPPGRVRAMLEDRRDGSLWFGTENEGLWRYDGTGTCGSSRTSPACRVR
ncbi:MAG: two-component regulator propeller domain-containing protein [Candidatus Latescibacterota bacterium]